MSQPSQQPKKPELKIGPFAGGIGVDVWQNHTRDGRLFRSITILPPGRLRGMAASGLTNKTLDALPYPCAPPQIAHYLLPLRP